MHSLLPVQESRQENYPAARIMGSPDTNKAKILIAHKKKLPPALSPGA